MTFITHNVKIFAKFLKTSKKIIQKSLIFLQRLGTLELRKIHFRDSKTTLCAPLVQTVLLKQGFKKYSTNLRQFC
jgi:DNA polymerase III epsilon subunit-like protein